MSTHNIGFYEEMAKIIFQLSSNMQLISSVFYGGAKLSNTHIFSTAEYLLTY